MRDAWQDSDDTRRSAPQMPRRLCCRREALEAAVETGEPCETDLEHILDHLAPRS